MIIGTAFKLHFLVVDLLVVVKNLQRKFAACPYYYCPLVDLLICMLCEVIYV